MGTDVSWGLQFSKDCDEFYSTFMYQNPIYKITSSAPSRHVLST